MLGDAKCKMRKKKKNTEENDGSNGATVWDRVRRRRPMRPLVEFSGDKGRSDEVC